MFDKDSFIADYIKAIQEGQTETQQEVVARLQPEHSWDFRKALVEGILSGLKDLEGDYANHEEFLSNQIMLIESAKLQEQGKEDSTNETTKDESKVEESTEDVDVVVSADEAVVRDDSNVEKAAESEGNAPAEEVEAEKSEA